MLRRTIVLAALCALLTPVVTFTQGRSQPDWTALQDETMRHFQALLRFDTTDPPGGEEPAALYLKDVLEKEGIPVQLFTLEPRRTNVVARLKGNGRKRPLLIMAHTDTVNVDPTKWTFPPFSATRDGGWVYSRGTLDDKDNVTASLMTMIMLKRLNVPLDRDVIFLAEAGEEGTTRVGIQFMVNQHFQEIDAEYCIAEGGSVTRTGGEVKFGSVQTLEKIPRGITLTARGVAGHGSVPLKSNAIVHLATAISEVDAWRGPLRVNETTAAYFKRLGSISSPTEARQYLGALSLDPKVMA
jgi:acetylornithine deacetylase/succinyl-diaminopimelate desuccinylase-like protein